jgi:hypothetical protein
MAFPLTIVPKLRTWSWNRFEQTIQGPVSLTIGGQNAIKSCRWNWNSDFFSFLSFEEQFGTAEL